MSRIVAACLCVWTLTILSEVSTARRRPVNYEYFDEYLLEVVVPDPVHPPQISRHTPSDTPARRDRVTDPDILGYFRDVPRRHWSCCMLGKLAGDKGFQCQATFYAVRIARRNINRAHNRKMLFHGPNATRNWGRDMMTTFSRCISRHEEEFHKCCQVAAVEMTERVRWREYQGREEL